MQGHLADDLALDHLGRSVRGFVVDGDRPRSAPFVAVDPPNAVDQLDGRTIMPIRTVLC